MSHDESLVLSNLPKIPNHYNRSYSDHQEDLTNTLKTQYCVADCLVTTSGMNAISTLTNAILIENNFEPIVIVCSDELYCDTPRLFDYLKFNYKCVEEIIKVDVRGNVLGAFEKLSDKVVIFHTETSSNPNGYIFDHSILLTMRGMVKKLYVILDNTWLTHVIFNPFSVCNLNNLFVVASLTKYYSGGTALGGVILHNNSENTIVKKCKQWIQIMGIHVSPHNCKLINNMAKTIDERIRVSSALTVLVVNYLNKRSKVYFVNHPVLKNALNGIYPSVLTFCLKGSKSKVLKVLSNQTILDFKTSFGSSKSKVDPWPVIIRVENEVFVRIRLAIGFDDEYEKIIAGLDNIIELI